MTLSVDITIDRMVIMMSSLKLKPISRISLDVNPYLSSKDKLNQCIGYKGNSAEKFKSRVTKAVVSKTYTQYKKHKTEY